MSSNSDFTLHKKNEVEYYTIPSFMETGLVSHLFTTRIGGVSPKPYDSMNLGIKTKDKYENIVSNFSIIAETFNFDKEKIVLSDQTHTTNIRIAQKNDTIVDDNYTSSYEDVDGLLTDKRGITLFTFYADCVPLFYLDKRLGIIGLAHAGWRGTVGRIAEDMIKTMINTYGSRVEDILVGIGPSIGPCCYEVGEEVYEKFNENFTNLKDVLIYKGAGKWTLNLWEANRTVLEDNGMICRNISVSRLCTCCNKEKFYSYRRDNGETGRMAAIIQLK